MDFRALNECLLSDSQALPDIPATLQSLGAARRYSAFDACAGFWGVRLRAKDRKFTAFHAIMDGSWHLFEWLRMPFGIKTCTATFQRMFMKIMGRGECTCGHEPRGPMRRLEGHTKACLGAAESLINSICLIFVDDGCVYSKREEVT